MLFSLCTFDLRLFWAKKDPPFYNFKFCYKIPQHRTGCQLVILIFVLNWCITSVHMLYLKTIFIALVLEQPPLCFCSCPCKLLCYHCYIGVRLCFMWESLVRIFCISCHIFLHSCFVGCWELKHVKLGTKWNCCLLSRNCLKSATPTLIRLGFSMNKWIFFAGSNSYNKTR
jgi:hypothetical protein